MKVDCKLLKMKCLNRGSQIKTNKNWKFKNFIKICTRQIWSPSHNVGSVKVLDKIVSIKKSLAFCRDVARRANANFSYAATLLPIRKREFFYASYAAMRIIDDIVDDEFLVLDPNERQVIRGRYQNILKSWLKQVCDLDDETKGPLDPRVITALQNTVGKSDMGITQWEELACSLTKDI